MQYLAAVLCVIGPLGEAIMLLLLMVMGKRLGKALEMPPYYRFYLAAVFFFLLPLPVSWILLLLQSWAAPHPSPDTVLAIKIAAASLPMTVAVTLALFPTAKY